MPNLPTVPDTIDSNAFTTALGSVGINTHRLVRLTATPKAIELEYFAEDDNGHLIAVSGGALRMTVRIPVRTED